jgi:hypothetical protein
VTSDDGRFAGGIRNWVFMLLVRNVIDTWNSSVMTKRFIFVSIIIQLEAQRPSVPPYMSHMKIKDMDALLIVDCTLGLM